MIKLNDMSMYFLEKYCLNSQFAINFSIIVLGDTHAGQICLGDTESTNLLMYSKILKEISRGEYKNVVCVIHGGDGTNTGNEEDLKSFINLTKDNLFRNTKIPFFMNIGNHEFIMKKNETTGNTYISSRLYKTYIGIPNKLICMLPQNLCIFLFCTGADHDGFINKSDELKFKAALDRLKYFIDNDDNSDMRYILDMHIPPDIDSFNQRTDYVLNNRLNIIFQSFIENHGKKIIAVFAHHQHWFSQYEAVFLGNIEKNKVPAFLTAKGGHCYSTKGKKPDVDNQYEFIKINFQHSNNISKIISVQKFSYDPYNDNFKASDIKLN